MLKCVDLNYNHLLKFSFMQCHFYDPFTSTVFIANCTSKPFQKLRLLSLNCFVLSPPFSEFF